MTAFPLMVVASLFLVLGLAFMEAARWLDPLAFAWVDRYGRP